MNVNTNPLRLIVIQHVTATRLEVTFVKPGIDLGIQHQKSDTTFLKCIFLPSREAKVASRDVGRFLKSLEFGEKTLLEQIKDANYGFARWEQVSTMYLIMQPFAIANGQLTQSCKVKRDAVTARYYDELPK
jgi:hypothetical protein